MTEVLPKNRLFGTTPEAYNIQGYNMFTSDFCNGRGIIIYTLESLCTTNIDIEINFKDMSCAKLN